MGAPFLFSSKEDCLQCPLRHDASSIRLQKNPKPNRKKRTPKAINASSQDRHSSASVVKHPGANLVMGQVKILKRGEKLSPDNNTTKKSDEGCESDLELGSTNRIGPDPDTMQKQVRVSDFTGEVYAGPTSMASPPPSSVPVPKFLGSLMMDLDD